jgi:hypothetical protein
MTGAPITPPLPNGLRAFSYLRRGATWRSGYATVCKTDRFAFSINGHSEKADEIDLYYVKRLGVNSERDPLGSVGAERPISTA